MSIRQADEEYDNNKELKKSHTTITDKKRQKLIEFVIKHNMTIYRAAKRLNICQPTAKFILKNYRLANNLPRITTKPPPVCKQQQQQPNHFEKQSEQFGTFNSFPFVPTNTNYPIYYYGHPSMVNEPQRTPLSTLPMPIFYYYC